MNFTPTESQQAVADLADRIMDDHLDMERHASIEAAGDWFDRDLWEDLAKAGLLGIVLGTDVGGGGLDAVALAVLLRTQGEHVAPYHYSHPRWRPSWWTGTAQRSSAAVCCPMWPSVAPS